MDQANGGNAALLALQSVSVWFGALAAVDDVSLTLHSGNLLGLIGPNGAGKTTLLRAICGQQPLTRGRALVMGEQVSPGADVMRHIGWTPDNPPVYEDLTVRQFLRFVAKAYDLDSSETDERIDFWLEKVWLREKTEQKVKQLSRGMRQRLGIARTLLPNPAVILLDEPAAGLDPAGRVQFRQLLCNLRDQGKTLIVSSHILADMSEYCTHIGIMAQGRLMHFGTVAEVAAGANGQRCRYTIVLARPVPRVEEAIGAVADVSGVQVENERITLEYSSAREDAAVLLAELIGQRLPVAAFTANAPGLEEAYLRTGIRQVD